MMAYAALNSHQPFTMVPNRYLDHISPTLTETQRYICEVVIRETYGWHRDSACISTTTFVNKSGCSRRAIITAKRQLIDMGILIELESGGGGVVGRYKLNLYYNSLRLVQTIKDSDVDDTNPREFRAHATELRASVASGAHVNTTGDKSTMGDELVMDADASSRSDELLSQSDGLPSQSPQSDRLLSQSDGLLSQDEVARPQSGGSRGDLNGKPSRYEEHSTTHSNGVTTADNSASDNASDDNFAGDDASDDMCDGNSASYDSSDVCQKSDTVVERTVDQVDTLDVCDTDISGPGSPVEQVTINDDMVGRGAMIAPPSIDHSIIYINKKQTEDTSSKLGASTRENISHVRSEFNKFFPDAEDNTDWALFGWAVSTYGIDKCMDKLEYIREYRKVHEINNPHGLFRTSLVKDYQPPRRVMEKIEAERRAKVRIEESRKRFDDWDRHVSNFDWESASAACQRLIDSLG